MMRSFLLFGLVTIFLNGCQLPSLAATIFETPPGTVLFQDDFSDQSSGWKLYNDIEKGTMDYFDSYFRIHVLGEYQMLSNSPGLNFTDTYIEADMIKVVGSADDLFGLACRILDSENYYFFVISSDGYYGIGKRVAGLQSILGSEGMLPSEIISQGKTMNHLRADCIGGELILFVNGQELARVEDFDLENGDVGILAGTMMDDENAVLFDNFSVVSP